MVDISTVALTFTLLVIYSVLLVADCAISHFEKSSTCPSCSSQLRSTDFLELVVANSSSSADSLKHSFQELFTKVSPRASVLTQEDVCSRLMTSWQNEQRKAKFLLKQFLIDSKSTGRNSGDLVRAYEESKQQLTQLKGALHTQKLEGDQTIADLQHRLQALETTAQGQRAKINERDRQLEQLRGLCSNENNRPNGSQGLRGGFSPSIQVRSSRPTGNNKRSSAPLRQRHGMDSPSMAPNGLPYQRSKSGYSSMNPRSGLSPGGRGPLHSLNRSREYSAPSGYNFTVRAPSRKGARN